MHNFSLGIFNISRQLVHHTPLRENPEKIKGFIINGRSINYIDSSAAEQLTELILALQKKGIRVMFVGAIGPARDVILKSDIIKVLERTKSMVYYLRSMPQIVLIRRVVNKKRCLYKI